MENNEEEEEYGENIEDNIDRIRIGDKRPRADNSLLTQLDRK